MAEPENGSTPPEPQPDANKMEVESQTADKDHEVSNPPPSAWAPQAPKTFLKEAEVNLTTGELKLYELHVRLERSQERRRVTGAQLMDFFQGKVPNTVDTFRQKSESFFQVFFIDQQARDMFHNKREKIGKTDLDMESFPPPNSPFWKPTPTIINTKMRLISVPAAYPLSKFEETLRAKVTGYIPGSAQFETYVHNRKVKNGNISFHVTKLRIGTPWLFIRVGDSDVQMENPLRPNSVGSKIPNSDTEAAEAAEAANIAAQAATQAAAQPSTQTATQAAARS